MQKLVRILTRKSPLAMWQAEFVKTCLLEKDPSLQIELVGMVTEGDRKLQQSLARIGGKALFIKELEQALYRGEGDIAVHSAKDLPITFPPGLGLGAILKRHDPRDGFISNDFNCLEQLPAGSVVGTASLRRQCLVRNLYPQLRVELLRGNVNTRLGRLDNGDFSGIILAAAGLERLQMQQRIQEYLPVEQFIPAVGQGAIAVEYALENEALGKLLETIHDPETTYCINAERAMNRHLQGGCQVPVAGFATLSGEQLFLRGLVGLPDGSKIITAEGIAMCGEEEKLGRNVAESLIEQGAKAILDTVKNT